MEDWIMYSLRYLLEFWLSYSMMWWCWSWRYYFLGQWYLTDPSQWYSTLMLSPFFMNKYHLWMCFNIWYSRDRWCDSLRHWYAEVLGKEVNMKCWSFLLRRSWLNDPRSISIFDSLFRSVGKPWYFGFYLVLTRSLFLSFCQNVLFRWWTLCLGGRVTVWNKNKKSWLMASLGLHFRFQKTDKISIFIEKEPKVKIY